MGSGQIPTMEERWLVAIMQAFHDAIQAHPALAKVFSAV